jgi:isochorismate hydrolase
VAVPAEDKRTVLVIVDMLSDYSFPDAEQLLEKAERPARHIRQARDVADTADVLVVYANDIHGLWSCSREQVCERALNGRRPELVKPLLPRPDDAFMHKGQHSAFCTRSRSKRSCWPAKSPSNAFSTRPSTPTCATTRSPCFAMR